MYQKQCTRLPCSSVDVNCDIYAKVFYIVQRQMLTNNKTNFAVILDYATIYKNNILLCNSQVTHVLEITLINTIEYITSVKLRIKLNVFIHTQNITLISLCKTFNL